MGIAVYVGFLLFNSSMFPPLFLKLKDRYNKFLWLRDSNPFPSVIDYCVVGFA